MDCSRDKEVETNAATETARPSTPRPRLTPTSAYLAGARTGKPPEGSTTKPEYRSELARFLWGFAGGQSRRSRKRRNPAWSASSVSRAPVPEGGGDGHDHHRPDRPGRGGAGRA